MRTIACNGCGHEVAEDDFIMQQCPICDSYMPLSRLNRKADSFVSSFIRIEPVRISALVECDLKT